MAALYPPPQVSAGYSTAAAVCCCSSRLVELPVELHHHSLGLPLPRTRTEREPPSSSFFLSKSTCGFALCLSQITFFLCTS